MKKHLINVQAYLLNLLPPQMQNSFHTVRLIPRYVDWKLHRKGYQHSKNVMLSYRNRYVGYRCVVIGNGPSLRKMNLGLLKNEYTFGLNRIYLIFEELGFETDFLVSINRLVIKQFAGEIAETTGLKIISWPPDNHLPINDQTVYIAPRPDASRIHGDLLQGYYPFGGTVTNVALEAAFFMGFSEVILIGVDHSFVETGVGNKAIVSDGPDRNHFSDNYFGKGVVWQLPDYKMMEYGYLKTKQLYEADHRKVVDATLGGKLQIFDKGILENYLLKSKFKNKVFIGI